MDLYSNEIVFRGHPDKVADQISDTLLDAYLREDTDSRCGIEVVGGKGKIFVTGEVTSNTDVDVGKTVKSVLSDIGYSTDYEVINNIGKQSHDISIGVDTGGAGDQGMMFGYATRETGRFIPKAMAILQDFSMFYDELCHRDKRFLPDGKAQITGLYDGNKLVAIKDFTISYQNIETDRNNTDTILISEAIKICNRYGIAEVENFHVNPTGKFLIGGFDGDAGLTGRKIVVDNYHSFANVGGGAFSGKDPTKVDRSAAYKARQLAIRYLIKHKEVDWCEIQISYAIGIDKPLAIYIKTNNGVVEPDDSMYEECKPRNIIRDLDLLSVNYVQTAMYGHFGLGKFSWEMKQII